MPPNDQTLVFRRSVAARGDSASPFGMEEIMGDKSPKSKEREQKQKGAAEAKQMAAAKSKQNNQSQFQRPTAKDKK